MNVFADFHHPALYYSLHLLFEERLGHQLYRPLGLEWHEGGHWKLLDLCVTDDQRHEKLSELLVPNAKLPYADSSWNRVQEVLPSHTVIAPHGSLPIQQRGISLEQFKAMDIDLIISSFSNNLEPFEQLAQQYHPKAKVVAHLGNEWGLDQFQGKNVMASIRQAPNKANAIVFYRQEFDLNLFSPVFRNPDPLICSFVQDAFCEEDAAAFQVLNQGLSDVYDFALYGKHQRDGYMGNTFQIAELMKRSKFGLHLKAVGDGFGHVVHNWAAVGRPIIFRGSQYKGKLAASLMEHMVTGIDLDVVGAQKCVDIIRAMSDIHYDLLCGNTRARFLEVVDFQQDAVNVQQFLRQITQE